MGQWGDQARQGAQPGWSRSSGHCHLMLPGPGTGLNHSTLQLKSICRIPPLIPVNGQALMLLL